MQTTLTTQEIKSVYRYFTSLLYSSDVVFGIGGNVDGSKTKGNVSDIVQDLVLKVCKHYEKPYSHDYLFYWCGRYYKQLKHSFFVNDGTKSHSDYVCLGVSTGVPIEEITSSEYDPTIQSLFVTEFQEWCDDNLTDNQKLIVDMIDQGYTKVEISQSLGCSKQNVGQQIKKIEQKYQESLS